MRAVLTVLAVLAVLGCRTEGGRPPDARAGPDTRAPAPSTPATGDPGAEAVGPTGPAGRDVVVTSITDGDTFRAGDERVRLIGIDTPEVAGTAECFGAEASAALARLIPVGTTVTLVSDVDTVDRYERTLAYVYRADDGLDVNLTMATEGFAVPLTVPPNVARESAFAAAAAEAREAGRGLWAACDDTGPPTSAPSTPPSTTSAPTPVGPTTSAPAPADGRAGCDPSYPDVCIPPAPPDLDCADVPHRRFRVLPPDPHRFDGGGDGVGCEAP